MTIDWGTDWAECLLVALGMLLPWGWLIVPADEPPNIGAEGTKS